MQYRKLIEQGKLQHDPNQEKVALALENVLGRLEQYEKDMEEYHVQSDYAVWIWVGVLVIGHVHHLLFSFFFLAGELSQLGEESWEWEAQSIDKGSWVKAARGRVDISKQASKHTFREMDVSVRHDICPISWIWPCFRLSVCIYSW